jgi:two-component system, NarL family, invasion response regulator UvrY
MKILVVDDHEFTREGIIRILSDNFETTKIARAGSYDEAMEHVRTGKWDILILDISLPGKSGLEIIHSVRAVDKDVPILILSMVPVSQYIRRVVEAGASGYLTKGEPAEELLKAVRTLTRGLKYFSPDVQQELPSLIDEITERSRPEVLSDRELAVLQGLAEGKSVKEIASQYKLTASTVHSYRKRIIAKLRIKSNLDLVRYALKNEIVR